MIEENTNKQAEIQTTELVQKVQKIEEKLGVFKEMVAIGNSKMVSDEVIIEIVHAFRDIIIEFIHRKY